jgi:hypothetical protein
MPNFVQSIAHCRTGYLLSPTSTFCQICSAIHIPTLHPRRWPLHPQVVIMTLKLNETSCNLIVCPQVRPITFLAIILQAECTDGSRYSEKTWEKTTIMSRQSIRLKCLAMLVESRLQQTRLTRHRQSPSQKLQVPPLFLPTLASQVRHIILILL